MGDNAGTILIGLAVAVVLGAIIWAALYGNSGPKQCSICGTQFKRNYYTWTMGEETRYLCPNCNRKLESRKSKAAMDKLLGE